MSLHVEGAIQTAICFKITVMTVCHKAFVVITVPSTVRHAVGRPCSVRHLLICVIVQTLNSLKVNRLLVWEGQLCSIDY